MDYTLTENHELEMIEVATYGAWSMEHFLRLLDQMRELDYFKSGKPVLVDHSNMNMDALDFNAMRSIVEATRTYYQNSGHEKHAVIVSRKPLDYGISRIWLALAETYMDIETRVFQDKNEAVAWLTQPVDN